VNLCIAPKLAGLALAFVVQFLLAPSACRAEFLLPITFQPRDPIVSGSNGSLSYNATTDDFKMTLSGPSLEYAAPFVKTRGFSFISSGNLTIDLSVDNSGNFVANGTGLTLTGTVSINGATFSGTLLTGTITDFGAQPKGPPSFSFDGYYTVTGGALTQTKIGTGGTPVFGGFSVGQWGGFILDAENVSGGTLGDFSHNFSSSSVKPEVGILLPEPSTLVLLSTGVVVLAGWRRVARRARLITSARPIAC
jgi:hypothetical protein